MAHRDFDEQMAVLDALKGSAPDAASVRLVKKALIYPARWLDERKVPITSDKYRAIIVGIVEGMVKHGQIAQVTYMGRYLLTCVQKHMEVRGDSEIALKWLRPILVTKGNGKRSADFILACQEAATACAKHLSVKTEWRGRQHSVTLFGH